jgi:Leucine-rich repeat (LRR) protein
MSEMTTETLDIVRKRISDWNEKGCRGYLYLDRLGLTEIPELPNNLERIWIQGNKIKHINKLPPSLTILNISDNDIEYIDTEFPETMTDLFISGNNLRCLPYLPYSLEILDVSYNHINTLPNIPRKLKWLYCWDNPVPLELIEPDKYMRFDICEESHKERIKLWKKFIKQ